MKPDDFLDTLPTMSSDQRLTNIVSVLTGPEGCPWDQKQTAETIINFVIDEAHELKEALKTEDAKEVTSEFGDLLFAMEFLKQRLSPRASHDTASQLLVEKMVRRHPHVFADQEFADEEELKKNWEREKRIENSARERYDQDIPASAPPLQKAVKVLSRASNAGFHYKRVEDAWDKVCEEFYELEQAVSLEESEPFQEELGDLLLSLLTVAKMKGCSAVEALELGTTKFCDRLQGLERLAGRAIQDIEHSELAELYQRSRIEFEQTERAYFNYCGVSPWPRAVRNAVRQACHRISEQGLTAALEMREEREQLRNELRSFARASDETSVVLVPNISAAALGVAHSQPWGPGSTIVLGKSEFPANTVPWKQAADTFQWEIAWFDEDLLRTQPNEGWALLERLLQTEQPKLLALSAVSFWSGFRLPLERIGALCNRYGCRLFVDGIQAFGTIPLRMVEGVDFLAGGSHKSLVSPEGAGFLIVSPRAQQDWVPRLSSWLSLPDPVNFLLDGKPQGLTQDKTPRPNDPTTLEGGSINVLGYAGLFAALRLLSTPGPEEALQYIFQLQQPLIDVMQARGWTCLASEQMEERSAILSFRPPQGTNLPNLQEKLTRSKISVGIPNGHLRFGFHRFTTQAEVAYAVRVIGEL